MNTLNRITKTVSDGLCHSCGACAAACPVDAISFVESVGGFLYPAIDDNLCIECGLCYKACAGSWDVPLTTHSFPGDPFAGNCLAAWVGHAVEPAVYAGGQSGGTVSQLLIHLLQTHQVDACAVVKMVPGSPPRPKAFLARTREEILTGQKSKYCPVPVLQVLRDAQRTDSRIAMVGLACHFHGLQRLRENGIHAASAVKYRIGLVCAGTLALAAVDYLVKVAKFDSTTTNLRFRDKAHSPFPGDVYVWDDAGHHTILPRTRRMLLKNLLTPARCRLCFDKMNVLADVTLGDPWGIKKADMVNGESILIARTKIGQTLIAQGLADQSLSLRPIAYDRILKGQAIESKRAEWRTYCAGWQQMDDKSVPGYYESIAPHALSVRHEHIIKYIHQLRRTLLLDEQPSRRHVLALTHWTILRTRIKRYFAKLLHYARRILNFWR